MLQQITKQHFTIGNLRHDVFYKIIFKGHEVYRASVKFRNLGSGEKKFVPIRILNRLILRKITQMVVPIVHNFQDVERSQFPGARSMSVNAAETWEYLKLDGLAIRSLIAQHLNAVAKQS